MIGRSAALERWSSGHRARRVAPLKKYSMRIHKKLLRSCSSCHAGLPQSMTKHALREELDASLAQAPLFVIALASLVMLRSPRRVFQQGQLDRLRLSRMFLARSVIWKPLGKLPEGIIQLPELPLQGAVGRFKPPGFWDAFEMRCNCSGVRSFPVSFPNTSAGLRR